MFIKASTIVLSLVAFANAAPKPELAVRTSGGDCNDGTVQCCNNAVDPQSVSSITGLLGLDLPPIGNLFGDCDGILNGLVLGTGNSCVQQTVCCENVQSTFGINCSPINVNL